MPSLVHLTYTTDPQVNHQDDLQDIGGALYPMIVSRLTELGYVDTLLASKVTGMLLELEMEELKLFKTNQEDLFQRVQEALEVLEEAAGGAKIGKVGKEDIAVLREVILSAVETYLEHENSDVEFAGSITDEIMQSKDLADLLLTAKIEANLKALIKTTIQGNQHSYLGS